MPAVHQLGCMSQCYKLFMHTINNIPQHRETIKSGTCHVPQIQPPATVVTVSIVFPSHMSNSQYFMRFLLYISLQILIFQAPQRGLIYKAKINGQSYMQSSRSWLRKTITLPVQLTTAETDQHLVWIFIMNPFRTQAKSQCNKIYLTESPSQNAPENTNYLFLLISPRQENKCHVKK